MLFIVIYCLLFVSTLIKPKDWRSKFVHFKPINKFPYERFVFPIKRAFLAYPSNHPSIYLCLNPSSCVWPYFARIAIVIQSDKRLKLHAQLSIAANPIGNPKLRHDIDDHHIHIPFRWLFDRFLALRHKASKSRLTPRTVYSVAIPIYI